MSSWNRTEESAYYVNEISDLSIKAGLKMVAVLNEELALQQIFHLLLNGHQ